MRIAALIVAALAVLMPAGASGQADGSCAAFPLGTSQVIDYDGNAPQRFRVPPGVTQLFVTAIGGHGGQEKFTHYGGAGGGVDAVVPVTPEECLLVYVAQHGTGDGGWGWASGGAHGRQPGRGSDGAGGGGASAILRPGDSTPIVVAAGGGGGGGDSYDDFDSYDGGGGGAGGNPAGNGRAAEHATGGNGGRGGGASGTRGSSGDSNGTNQADDPGAGGGGGGGLKGGGGGEVGDDSGSANESDGGGGGGGGGRSGLPNPRAQQKLVSYFVSSGFCPYKSPYYRPVDSGWLCDGEVTIGWTPPGAATQPPPAPARPLVRVLSLDSTALVSDGLPISITPVATPLVAPPAASLSSTLAAASVLEVELSHRCGGRSRRVSTVSVAPGRSSATRALLELTRTARKRIAGCISARDRATGHVELGLQTTYGGRSEQERLHLYGR